MNRLSITFMILFFITIMAVSGKQAIYYLHNLPNFEENDDIREIISNPYNIPVKIINCLQKNCQKYKVHSQYPQLVLWNGPGCSYKRMETQTLKSLEQYFLKVQSSPIKPLKDFLEGLTLLQAFEVAIVSGTILYFIFTFLFKDRSGVSQANDKQKIK